MTCSWLLKNYNVQWKKSRKQKHTAKNRSFYIVTDTCQRKKTDASEDGYAYILAFSNKYLHTISVDDLELTTEINKYDDEIRDKLISYQRRTLIYVKIHTTSIWNPIHPLWYPGSSGRVRFSFLDYLGIHWYMLLFLGISLL